MPENKCTKDIIISEMKKDISDIRKDSKIDRDREEKVRHEFRGWIQTNYTKMDSKIDNLHTDIEILKKQDVHFVDKVDNIEKIIANHMKNEEKSMDKLFGAIEKLRTDLKEEYVSKIEHSKTTEKLATINNILKGIGGAIGLTLIAALLKLIII